MGAPEDPHLVLKEHDTDGRIALRAPEERTTKALWAAQERPVPWSAAVHGGCSANQPPPLENSTNIALNGHCLSAETWRW
ncbi:hypothetical protein EII34_10715 [Arachnia propionica]|uniref:Uncharacterized protein n=1 Tax=Arachnia propionica TaxID=1750 RepID=A0A3P1T451_9ACTN|nr:hypothetical protein [Arachnia propionica]RRD04297.1 hypothetical protein EII34_10715 [Arachnia propionica]